MFSSGEEINFKSIHRFIDDMVKKTEQKLELELNQKRDRLRHQLLQEQLAYQKEIKAQHDFLIHHQFDEKVHSLDQMNAENEIKRQQFVEQKQLQQELNNSMELRELKSKKILQDTKLSQIQQIQIKAQRRAEEEAQAQAWHEIEKRTQYQKDLQEKLKEFDRNQTNWNVVQTLDKQVEAKLNNRRMEKDEREIEGVFLERKVKECEFSERQRQLDKLRETELWKKDLERQMEYQRRKREFERLQTLESEKLLAQYVQSELEKESARQRLKKEQSHVESLEFLEYAKQSRTDDMKYQSNTCGHGYNDNEEKSAAERQTQKERLREIQKAAYLDALHRKRSEQLMEKRNDQINFFKTQQENAEFNRKMAEAKLQNMLQIRQDLDRQVGEKNLIKMIQAENDTNDQQKRHNLEKLSSTLIEKVSSLGLDCWSSKHPFHQSLMRKPQ